MWFLLFVACTPTTPLPAQGTASVLTYNVQGLPDALSDSPRPTPDRMTDISPHLDDYDIAGLQEDFDADWHTLLLADATHPSQHHTTDLLDDSRVYSAGLSLLSRVGAEVAYEEVFYDQCVGVIDNGSDCFASKGFQVLTLDLGDGDPLSVINTHHEAGGSADDNVSRLSQIDQVLAWMDAHPGRAVLFMGDTNLRPSDPDDTEALARYADAGLRDACTEVVCDEPDHIDRLYARDGDAVALTFEGWERPTTFLGADGGPLSDHDPITAQVRWIRTAP